MNNAATTTDALERAPKRLYQHLYVQVLIAIALGGVLGYAQPTWGIALKPLGDAFVKLIKMLIAPIIFTTVVVGIAGMGDMKKVGRVGGKALLYFEVITTFALLIGLAVVNLVQPGSGVNANPTALDTKDIQSYTSSAKSQTTADFLLNIIPKTFVDAFAGGEILQVLFVAILTGFALTRLGAAFKPVTLALNKATHVFMSIIGIIMKAAPIGAFGAMAFTIGKFGVGTLLSLGSLMLCMYVTCAAFVVLVLGGICHFWVGVSIFDVIRYMKEELLIVVGTSSSEAVLPALMTKMEALGCSEGTVGIVVPSGYSFNLDGTSIYLTMAAMFVAQATNTPLTLTQELGILLILMLTSKGAAGVVGSGFVTLAATLGATGTIPVAGMVLLLGIDRFMSEARSVTNFLGNTVATLAIARWEGELDRAKLRTILTARDTTGAADDISEMYEHLPEPSVSSKKRSSKKRA
jgi:aerobic C4-dicarboxylate transport protein